MGDVRVMGGFMGDVRVMGGFMGEVLGYYEG